MIEAMATFLAPVVFWRGEDPLRLADAFIPAQRGYVPPESRVATVAARLNQIAALSTAINYKVARMDF